MRAANENPIPFGVVVEGSQRSSLRDINFLACDVEGINRGPAAVIRAGDQSYVLDMVTPDFVEFQPVVAGHDAPDTQVGVLGASLDKTVGLLISQNGSGEGTQSGSIKHPVAMFAINGYQNGQPFGRVYVREDVAHARSEDQHDKSEIGYWWDTFEAIREGVRKVVSDPAVWSAYHTVQRTLGRFTRISRDTTVKTVAPIRSQGPPFVRGRVKGVTYTGTEEKPYEVA